MILRPYQEKALDDLWEWFVRTPDGNPIVEAAVGAGKSLVLAALAQRADREAPGTRILVLVHQRELLDQNVAKLRAIWPEASLGVYSAAHGRKDIDAQVTYATIGSVYKIAHKLGRIDLVMADECFVAGTMVHTPTGAKPIECIAAGDVVKNAVGFGVVQATKIGYSNDLVRVEFGDGKSITCTASHPFFTERGWQKACDLEKKQVLYSEQGVRKLFQNFCSVQESGGNGLEKTKGLLNILLQETGKPDAHTIRPPSHGGEVARDRAPPQLEGRQWLPTHVDGARPFVFAGTGLDVELPPANGAPSGFRLPESLQTGHQQFVVDDMHRSGWGISCQQETAGLQENCAATVTRVESVTRVCGTSRLAVYNLQVSGHPSYFAGGVLVHNCHLIPTKDTGMWRKFLSDLAKYNPHTRCIGWTGTPFRGNGVFLTAGDDPLFTHVAARVTMSDLLQQGYLAPLTSVRTDSRLSSEGISISGGDFAVDELAERADKTELVQETASEICRLFSDRKRWLVFAVTVQHAEHVCAALRERGVAAECVTGDTPQALRDARLAGLRSGRLRCLVNVATLTTGVDVPDLDAIALLRATKSPVLLIQIAGRGMRIAAGKTDCLFADFTDTLDRMGPIDKIQGRLPPSKGGAGEAPFRLCPNCGSRNKTGALHCDDCGHEFPPPERIKHGSYARGAAALSTQQTPAPETPVTAVTYALHQRPGSTSSMRVDYFSGLERVASEWVLLSHAGYPRIKAERWWSDRRVAPGIPVDAEAGVQSARAGGLRKPTALRLAVKGKYVNVIGYSFE
jgi:DNA repair protein RadD